MSITSFTLPATVDAKAAGQSITLDVSSFHPDAIAAIFAYGARRWMQDHVNAAAHAFKQSGAEGTFDAQAVIAARIAQAVSGNMTVRAGGTSETFTAFENTLYEVAVGLRGESAWGAISTAWSLSKGKQTDERKRIILDTIETMPEPRRNALHDAAKQRLALAESLKGLDI